MALCVAALGLIPGCIKVNADEAGGAQATARVKNPAIAVQPSTLANTLSGSFDLTISVDKSSTEDAVFSDPPSFDLISAQGGSAITPLDAVADADPFPLTLGPGKSTTLSFTLSNRNTVSSEDLAKLCSGPVVIVAVLTASSGGNPTTAESSATSASGCF